MDAWKKVAVWTADIFGCSKTRDPFWGSFKEKPQGNNPFVGSPILRNTHTYVHTIIYIYIALARAPPSGRAG